MTHPVRIPEVLTPLLRDINTVSQHPRNPNSGDVDAIVESMLTVGYTAPIVVQASTGFIIAGNHRYAAMLSLGATHIPVIEVAWDDETALRHLVGDNQTSALGHRDEADLLRILRELAQTDAGLVGTGHTVDDMAGLLRAITPHEGMFAHLSPSVAYGVMVTCDSAETAEHVVSILDQERGVATRIVTL